MNLYSLSTSIIPDNSVEFTATLIIAGLSVVLGILALLIIVVKIYGLIVSKTQGVVMRKSKKNKAQPAHEIQLGATPAPPIAAAQAPVASGVSEEIVAAISAAVYMMEGEGAVISAITPVQTPARQQRPNPVTRRNPWAMAAISENTRPF